MIEPSGMKVDVLGLPARQTKVATGPASGAKGQKQGHVYSGAQDDPATASLSKVDGMETPGKTQREMPRSTSGKQGQDSGSIVGGFDGGFGLGQINKGAPEQIGHFAVGGGPGVERKTKQTNPDPDPGVAGTPGSWPLVGQDGSVLPD